MGLFKDVDVLLIVENGIKDRMCHAIMDTYKPTTKNEHL